MTKPRTDGAGLDSNMKASAFEGYFDSLCHSTAYGALNAIEDTSLIVLTSDSGLGKTLLLNRFIHEAPEHLHCVSCAVGVASFEQLLDFFCTALNIDQQATVEQQLETLQHQLEAYAEHGLRIIWLIDDAHSLPLRTLAVLMALLEHTSRSLAADVLHIVLSGWPKLVKHLHELDPVEFPIVKSASYLSLVPLNDAEAAVFIHSQLKAVSQTSKTTKAAEFFTPGVVERIAHHSRGIPFKIIVLCEKSWQLAQAQNKPLATEMVDTAAGQLLSETVQHNLDEQQQQERAKAEQAHQSVTEVATLKRVSQPTSSTDQEFESDAELFELMRKLRRSITRWSVKTQSAVQRLQHNSRNAVIALRRGASSVDVSNATQIVRQKFAALTQNWHIRAPTWPNHHLKDYIERGRVMFGPRSSLLLAGLAGAVIGAAITLLVIRSEVSASGQPPLVALAPEANQVTVTQPASTAAASTKPAHTEVPIKALADDAQVRTAAVSATQSKATELKNLAPASLQVTEQWVAHSKLADTRALLKSFDRSNDPYKVVAAPIFLQPEAESITAKSSLEIKPSAETAITASDTAEQYVDEVMISAAAFNAGHDTELSAWKKAESSAAANSYQRYLEQFPQGIFAPVAAKKIQQLNQSSHTTRIENLLDKAWTAFNRKAFTTPVDDNAVKWAEMALKQAPSHIEAGEVMVAVIDAYLEWSQQSLDHDKISSSRFYLQKAQLLRRYASPMQINEMDILAQTIQRRRS